MDISTEQEVHFRYDNFIIVYNITDKIWYALHDNEDKFSDIQIIIKENLPIELFGEYELTSEEMKELEVLLATNIS